MVARSIGKMENILKSKSHPCKNCIISVVCIQPCEKYYPELCVLNKTLEYKRAMNYAALQKHKIIIKIRKNKHFNISEKIICFYKNGRFHRDGDKPAVIFLDGRKEYWKNGVLHRDGDKPAVIYSSGTEKYYKNGKFHRDGDKPAMITTYKKEYRKNGKIHRDGDKPAVIYNDGCKEYWKNGKYIKVKISSM